MVVQLGDIYEEIFYLSKLMRLNFEFFRIFSHYLIIMLKHSDLFFIFFCSIIS